MFGSSYKIATVWGIPIKIHMSLIVVTAFFVLREGITDGATAMVDRLLLAVGIFTSIALHELGHSYVALRLGCRVREITLMFMGGAASMERIPSRPRGELAMALAGPAVSVVLGFAGFWGGRALVLSGVDYTGYMIYLLGWINLFLAGFNLLPAFPMDGGRVFRALLTPKFGRLKATFIASRLGRIIAILFGVYGFMATPTQWILVAIAFFIYSSAGREYEMVRRQHAARHGGGFGGTFRWPFGQPTPPPPQNAGDDDVVIGPPPYARRGQQHSEVERE